MTASPEPIGTLTAGVPRVTTEGGRKTVSADVTYEGDSKVLRFTVSEGTLEGRGDAFLAALLPPAMKRESRLTVAGGVSPRLLAATRTIQEIFWKWHPETQRVPIVADPRRSSAPPGSREVGCFFSGGVDSFYSLLKHQDEVTTLILVHGFDVALEDHDLWGKVSKEIREVACELGKGIVEVETNLRSITDPIVDWNDLFGCALASVALALAPRFERVLVPSSNSYGYMEPHGSHPLLDPLWSTEDMEIVHDGGEADRDEKVARIAGNESVSRHLRVCWRNTGGAYNCGKCEKCLRTMICLLAVGGLDRCTTFESGLNEAAVAAMEITSGPLLRFAEENLRRLERTAAPSGVSRGLRVSIERYRSRLVGREIGAVGASLVQSPEWMNARDDVLQAIWETQRRWLCQSIFEKGLKAARRAVSAGPLPRLLSRRPRP